MTALSITAANVVLLSGEPIKDAVSGEAFDAGDNVYLAADGTWLKATSAGTPIQAGANGLAVALATADAAGARVSLAGPGCIVDLGAGTAGIIYCVGPTAGDLNPHADLSGENVSVIGVGITGVYLKVSPIYHAGAVIA